MIGAFYLTEKLDAPDFTREDEELITSWRHTPPSRSQTRGSRKARELSIVAERNRLALDLHDAVSQKLFGLVLEAEAAATLLERASLRRPRARRAAAGARPRRSTSSARSSSSCAADLARDGLGGALRKHVVLRQLGHEQVELVVAVRRRRTRLDADVLRIAQEALQNALRHAAPARSSSASAGPTAASSSRSRTTASASTRSRGPLAQARPDVDGERARRIGATLEIGSTPGVGTTVRLEADGG